MTARERKRYWIQQQNKKRRIVIQFTNRFYKALQHDVNGFVAAYESGGQQAARAYASSFVMSRSVLSVMNAMYREVGARYAKESFNSLDKEKAFETLSQWFNAIMNYIGIEFYNKGILRITETTKRILIALLDKSIVEGWGYYETAKHIQETMPAINMNRAEMIARTEAGKAIHAGTNVGADQSPFEKEKTWIAAHDQRTRGNPINGSDDHADHWNLDGQTVDFNDSFYDSRAKEFLVHPHDPKGSAASVIQCRCTYAVTNKRDANGRLIRKSRFRLTG